LNQAIVEEFRRQGIEIPFPQREVRLLGGAAA
jgi:small-conductance mechanosensitive channel